jgi:hypothetical protein
MMSPAERQRLEMEAAAMEAEYLRAQEAARRGQFDIAINIGKLLKQKQPLNIRIGFFLNDCESRSRQMAMEQARLREFERQRQLEIARQRRQAELVLAAERARQDALARAATIAAADRQRQREEAQRQLLSQAQIAVSGRNFSIAVQLYDSALALGPTTELTLQHEPPAAAGKGSPHS